MDRETKQHLLAESQASQEAEVALVYCQGLFDQMRREIMIKLSHQSTPENEVMFHRTKLVALTDIENRIRAAIRNGEFALEELKGGL